jgi:hypothetical protein
MPPKRGKKPVPRPRTDSPKPEPTAGSSTAAKANRARKDSLKVKQNEEVARAIAASKRLEFDLSDDTDAGVELEPESQLPRFLSLLRSPSPPPSQFLTQNQALHRPAKETQTQELLQS